MANSLKSGNPVWNTGFQHAQAETPFQPGAFNASPAAAAAPGTMTVAGTVNASFILLGLCGAAFVGGWSIVSENKQLVLPVMIGGAIVGLITTLILCFKPMAANILGPIYAVAEGAFLGTFSRFVDNMFAHNDFVQEKLGGSIAGAAGLMTVAVFGGMLGAYKMGLIRPTQRFYSIMSTIGIGLLIFCLVSLGFSLFGTPLVKVGSPLGIGVAAIFGLFAAFSLIADFDFVEKGAAMGLPKRMEWYGGFGLLSGLIFLYWTILRILIEIAASRE